MSDSVPAGWYPMPDGQQRYWDGARWTNLPPAFDESEVKDLSGEAVPSRPVTLNRNKRKLFIAAGVIVMVLILTGAGITWKVIADADAAVVLAAAEAAEKEANAAAQAVEATKAAEEAERQIRVESVVGIEASVKTMAEGHAAEGLVEGPILEAKCSPVNGGSTDDLNEQTTVFDCFVANVDNGDGTMSGYYYNATMNWTTGSYTYGLGRG